MSQDVPFAARCPLTQKRFLDDTFGRHPWIILALAGGLFFCREIEMPGLTTLGMVHSAISLIAVAAGTPQVLRLRASLRPLTA